MFTRNSKGSPPHSHSGLNTDTYYNDPTHYEHRFKVICRCRDYESNVERSTLNLVLEAWISHCLGYWNSDDSSKWRFSLVWVVEIKVFANLQCNCFRQSYPTQPENILHLITLSSLNATSILKLLRIIQPFIN